MCKPPAIGVAVSAKRESLFSSCRADALEATLLLDKDYSPPVFLSSFNFSLLTALFRRVLYFLLEWIGMEDREKKPLIEIKGVAKRYKESSALSGVDFNIYPGEFVILVGPSGAGKSTLVRLLIREEKPDAGRIRVAGRDITRLSARELPYYRRNIGIVFQDYKLLPTRTVWENVAYALEVSDESDEDIERRIPKVLAAVGLKEKADAYPDELSGGEQQRVSIARALAHIPKILIADEPTGNLDPQVSREIADILEKINCQGTTVLLATHNRELVDRMRKRVVVMKEGKIVSDQNQGKYTC